MVSTVCLLLLLVAAMGHCDESAFEFFRKTVILANNVSKSFGDEMVMEITDQEHPVGEQMTLTEALTRLLSTEELDKYVAETTNKVKQGFKCRVMKYTALASKLGLRTVDTAMTYSGDTQEYVVAYTKAIGMSVAETVSNLVPQFYESMAGNVTDETNDKLTAIDSANAVVPNDVLKEGAKGSIHKSVAIAAEEAANEATQKISGIFNRTDGDLVEALKEFTDLKDVNIGNFNTKIDELLASIESKTGDESEVSKLHRYTVDNMPGVTADIAIKISVTVYGDIAERTLQHLKNALDEANNYLPDQDRPQIKDFIDELNVPLTLANPDGAHDILTKLFEWSTGKITNDCTAATDHETLYPETLMDSAIVKDAFSDSQLTANCLLDKEVCVVDKLKTEYEFFPDVWKAVE